MLLPIHADLRFIDHRVCKLKMGFSEPASAKFHVLSIFHQSNVSTALEMMNEDWSLSFFINEAPVINHELAHLSSKQMRSVFLKFWFIEF